MAEFALLIADQLKEVRRYNERPVNIPHKGVQWFPVVREEGTPFEGIDGDNFIIRRAPPSPPEPGTKMPQLVASVFTVNISGGDIPAIDGYFNIAAGIYWEIGQYMLLFLSPQPDDSYFVTIDGGAPCMAVAAKTADYVIIEAKDAIGGSPVDPAQFGIQVYRT